MQTFKIYSLINFQLYTKMLLTIHSRLSISSPKLIYLITGGLYTLTTLTHSSHPQQPSLYLWFLWVWIFFLIPHINEIIWYLSFSDLLQLAYSLKVHPWISFLFFMTKQYSILGHLFIYFCLLQFPLIIVTHLECLFYCCCGKALNNIN